MRSARKPPHDTKTRRMPRGIALHPRTLDGTGRGPTGAVGCAPSRSCLGRDLCRSCKGRRHWVGHCGPSRPVIWTRELAGQARRGDFRGTSTRNSWTVVAGTPCGVNCAHRERCKAACQWRTMPKRKRRRDRPAAAPVRPCRQLPRSRGSAWSGFAHTSHSKTRFMGSPRRLAAAVVDRACALCERNPSRLRGRRSRSGLSLGYSVRSRSPV